MDGRRSWEDRQRQGRHKGLDFANPPVLQAGLNRFTASPGALAYPNVDYFVVLSGFVGSLSIMETTSDDEDPVGYRTAMTDNSAKERALGTTGEWSRQTEYVDGTDTVATLPEPSTRAGGGVLRLAVEGSRRDHGVLASSYGQAAPDQEILSRGDNCCFDIDVGAADRYLVRRFSVHADNAAMGADSRGPDYGVFEFSNLFSEAVLDRPLEALSASERSDLMARFEHKVSDHMPLWVRLPLP